MDDFLSYYIEYMRETEPPYIYHRWSAIASIGAILGRSYHFKLGHFRIFPNLYCLLVGDAGTRKSTAIKLAKKLVSSSGYATFASTKTSKEQFLLDLEASSDEGFGLQDTGTQNREGFLDATTDGNLWGSNSFKQPKEVFIVSDEFSEFSGLGNGEFYTTLGNLWDWDDEDAGYSQRLKNSKSVNIFQPTVSILGGTTSGKFAKIFPPEIMEDGFLSRLIIIGGQNRTRNYPFPPDADPEKKGIITSWFKDHKHRDFGHASLDQDARSILADLYNSWEDIADHRFKSYSNRRYTQLIKLALISSLSRRTAPLVVGYNVIEANTWLTAAEGRMASAIGEFGKSKNSDIANKLMEIIDSASKPLTVQDLWKEVHKDLDKIAAMADLLNGLQVAGKIQMVKGLGWLPSRAPKKEATFVDWSLLTEEER